MKNLKFILANALIINGLYGLGFGGIGNISASMGGAGVALRNSQWALYYNPALLGLDKKSRLAYSIGVSVRDSDFLPLATIDYQNIKDMSKRIESEFGIVAAKDSKLLSSATLLGAFSSTPVAVGGIFGDILGNINFTTKSGAPVTGLKSTEDIKNFLVHIANNAGASATEIKSITDASNLTDAASSFQSIVSSGGITTAKGENAFIELKDSLTEAMDKTDGDTRLLKGIVENLSSSQVSGIAELLTKAEGGKTSIGLNEFLTTLGSVSLSANGDEKISRFIRDVHTVKNTLSKDSLSITSQNGLIFQIGGKGVDGRGAIAFGGFISGVASLRARIHSQYDQLIIATGSDYAKIEVLDDKITLNSSSKADFDDHSILSNNARHELVGTSLVIGEIPIGYGQAFSTSIGNFSIGFATKYIYANAYSLERIGSIEKLTKISNSDIRRQNVQTFGLDLGALYNYANLSVGIVSKNINAPSIKLSDTQKIVIDPQVRAGVSYEWQFLSLALDMDLTSNHTLSYLSPRNQMIGGGMMLDFKYVDFRFGSMYDLRGQSDEGLIFTGGLNILGFLDIAIQSSAFSADKMPHYLSVKIGGGFSW